jgi:DNA (cytosine-5)-methyltransferase 1
MGGPGHHGRAGGLNLRTAAVQLFPTPKASDGAKGGPNQRGSSGDLTLPSAVILLPTPTAMDSKGSGGSNPANVTLTDAVVRTSLGATTNPRFGVGN